MNDDLHPETTLAKIRRGEVTQPDLPSPVTSPLTSQLDRLLETDVTKNRLATWWNKGQITQVVDLLTLKSSAAGQIREFQSAYNETIRLQITGRVQAEVDRLFYKIRRPYYPKLHA